MRTLSQSIPLQYERRAKVFLDALADKSTSHEEYANSFHEIGKILGQIMVNDEVKNKSVLLCCTNEDADFLGDGILDIISPVNRVSVSVLWNKRFNPEGNKSFAVAPVVRTYFEPVNNCDFMIICKSIIFNSCVVKSNIQHLFEKVKPKHIIIVAPVIFKGADNKLRDEFPANISKEFQFLYLAQDDEAKDGEVIPGIGGSIYERIGIGTQEEKNSYVPDLVKQRRENFQPA